MRKVLCAGIAVLAAMLAPAVAADLSVAPIYKAPPAPTANWSGSYIGLSGGGVWGNAGIHNGTTGDVTPGFNLNGAIVGVTSGLQLQNGQWVIGYEGDTSYTTKKGDAANVAPFVAGTTSELKERWLSTFRGRVGVTQDNWLIYATAGGALASIQQNVIAPGVGSISETNWHWGWTVGAGLEWKLGREWSAKVEYLYVGLQDKAYFNPAPVPFQSDQRVRLDDHLVRVGVNYKLPWSMLDGFFKR